MPEPILISFLSHTDGIEKTAISHSIAAILSKDFGIKVLLIDANANVI